MKNVRWDDLVFTNRNQSYGAYVLRKMYPNRMTMSFGFAMAVVATLLASPNIKAMFGDKEIVARKKVDDIKVTELVIPPVIPITPPPTPPAQQVAQIKYVPPRVTQEEVEETLPTIEELRVIDPSTQTTEGIVVVDDGPVVETPPVEAEDVTKVWLTVEQAPEYIGGYAEMMKFIAKNTKYPSSARRMGIQGTVYISFVVNADGTINDVQTIKGVQADCDNEAVRVISKMPAWKPGKQNGKAVKVRFVVPIKFKLDS